MKLIKRILIGIVVLILLVVGVGYLWLKGTAPEYSGTLTLEGPSAEITVQYDRYGIPHIEAANQEDAYFALGYVHAQDRLFQMEMIRRAASGRLSEILGKDLVKTDKFFRALSIVPFAKRHAALYLSADTSGFQKSTHAYLRGVNAFVKNGKTPLEFTIVGIPKTEFTDEDLYMTMGFMAFGFAEGIRVDPVLENIRRTYGDAYLKDLAVQTPATAVRIPNYSGPIAPHAQDPLISSISEVLDNIPVPLLIGSNGWAISGTRTTSGKPILANDTHIGFAQPAVWYEAHLEYPGFSFYGHHLAGVPFGVLGNNRYAGWGLTMFENDDTDFYYETINPDNANEVKYKGEWTPMTVRDEVIKVKGGEDVTFQVRETPHGPILNEVLTDLGPEMPPVSLWWELHKGDNQVLQAVYALNHAGRFEEAQKAASMIAAPGLNVMYADTDGNIAWWAVARLPIRPAHVVSKFFLDGASGKDEMEGYYPFERNPHSVNPPSGFTYSANNQPDTVQGVLYPGYYYPRSRAGRIVTLLSQDKKWDIAEVQKVNTDVVSTMHAELSAQLAAQLGQLPRTDLQEIIPLLANWNGDHQLTDVAPSIYYNLLGNLLALTMKDELGEKGYHSIMTTSIVKNSYDMLLNNEASPWWDNVKTKDKVETRADILSVAMDRTIENLKRTSGSKPSDWTWGKIHTITHPHALGAVKPLDKFFNVGPLSAPGGSEVINNLHFDIDTTGYFPIKGGPALRKVTDFADIEHGVTVSPSGQSGNLMSPFYDDQATMFVKGESRLMMMSRKEIAEKKTATLVIRPAGK